MPFPSMLFHFGLFDKRESGSGRSLRGHVDFAPPARQRPFRMVCKPLHCILFATLKASAQRQLGKWPLFGARAGSRLEAKHEHEHGHVHSFRGRAYFPVAEAK